MPEVFRLRPKSSEDKLFRPPSYRKPEETAITKRSRGIRNSRRWRSLRDAMVRHNPVCELCKDPTDDVHHIVPLSENPDLGFKKTNMLCVCKRCHETIHVQEDQLGENNRELYNRLASEREQ